MGNYLFKEDDNYEYNTEYLKDLRIWERQIQENNLKVNNDTNNPPGYTKVLNDWVNKIKLENFVRNKNTNNPPDYINNLKQENQDLRKKNNELIKIFKDLSIEDKYPLFY